MFFVSHFEINECGLKDFIEKKVEIIEKSPLLKK